MGQPAHRNPFRVQRTDMLNYRSAGEPWPEAMARLRAMGWRGAVVGPHGTGKTTLLTRLRKELSERGFEVLSIRLNREQRTLDRRTIAALRRTGAEHFVLLDGAEQVGWVTWRRVRRWTRSAGGVVITTHQPGRLPTWLHTRSDPALLVALAEELIDHARASGELDETPSSRLSETEAADLLRTTGGDMRAALRLLYDRWAGSG